MDTVEVTVTCALMLRRKRKERLRKCEGVMSGAINWEMLKNQYFSNDVFREELFDMIQSPEGHFPVYHKAGQKFAQDFPESLSHVEKMMKDDLSPETNASSNMKSVSSLDEKFAAHEAADTAAAMLSKKNKVRDSERLYSSIASAGGGFHSLSFSLPKFNILQNFSFAKRKISKRDSLGERKNMVLRSAKSKCKISRPDFTPVGIRPKNAAHLKTVTFEPYMEVKDTLTWEAVQFMRGVMDECTHLGNFSVPVDPSLVIIVAAKKDGYMPRNGIIPLTEIWPGSEMRTLDSGHITGYLFNHQVFRKAIRDSFSRVIDKYYS